MSTPVRLPQGWGHVTLAEFGALDTLRRGADAVIAACDAYRRTYTVPPGPKYWTPAGEQWVRDLCARYAAVAQLGNENEPAMLALAKEWLREAGTLAAVNVARILKTGAA